MFSSYVFWQFPFLKAGGGGGSAQRPKKFTDPVQFLTSRVPLGKIVISRVASQYQDMAGRLLIQTQPRRGIGKHEYNDFSTGLALYMRYLAETPPGQLNLTS